MINFISISMTFRSYTYVCFKRCAKSNLKVFIENQFKYYLIFNINLNRNAKNETFEVPSNLFTILKVFSVVVFFIKTS